jgi:hypothetical protein
VSLYTLAETSDFHAWGVMEISDIHNLERSLHDTLWSLRNNEFFILSLAISLLKYMIALSRDNEFVTGNILRRKEYSLYFSLTRAAGDRSVFYDATKGLLRRLARESASQVWRYDSSYSAQQPLARRRYPFG